MSKPCPVCADKKYIECKQVKKVGPSSYKMETVRERCPHCNGLVRVPVEGKVS